MNQMRALVDFTGRPKLHSFKDFKAMNEILLIFNNKFFIANNNNDTIEKIRSENIYHFECYNQ